MEFERKPDFSGWVTKHGVMCADGRTMAHGAFKDQDKMRVPLVWAHKHDDPGLVLGHTVLEERDEGTYGYGFLNNGPKAGDARVMLEHGDVDSMSIWANHLTERAGIVTHGVIREVSLVLAGANPEAKIENVHLQHGEHLVEIETEAIITMGEVLEHAGTEAPAPTEPTDKSIEDIVAGMTEEQQNAVAYLVVAAANGDIEHDAVDQEQQPDGEQKPDDENEDQTEDVDPDDQVDKKDDEEQPDALPGDNIQHSQGGTTMTNAFEQGAITGDLKKGPEFTHDDMKKIMARGAELNSFKTALKEHLEHADGDYGIKDIDELFPNAKNIRQTPDWIKRKTEWVTDLINGTHQVPFTRIRSMSADITHDEARALGYIKGNLKKEEFFGIKSRVTTPKTIYKKQKLDRDDILDITEFDVVVWMKGEMRLMLEEEIARAILLGDGRPVELDNGDINPDKIDENHIRPILTDHEFYSHKVTLSLSDDGSDVQEWMEAVLRSRKVYKGSGSPTFYTTEDRLTDALLSKDGVGRRHFKTVEDVAAELRVSRIVTVDVMEKYPHVLGILVNPSDYTVGTDSGGKITSFEDFDIDYNQHKYLLETRFAGALTRHKSAVVFLLSTADAVTPAAPTKAGNVVTIPSSNATKVSYYIDGQKVTGTYTLTEDEVVTADANDGYYIPAEAADTWAFTFTPA